jgi:hypothetical protein
MMNLKVQWAPINGIMDNGINRLMGSIYLICQIPNDLFLPYVCLVLSLIRINQLLESVSLCPKVIPLSGVHCINI